MDSNYAYQIWFHFTSAINLNSWVTWALKMSNYGVYRGEGNYGNNHEQHLRTNNVEPTVVHECTRRNRFRIPFKLKWIWSYIYEPNRIWTKRNLLSKSLEVFHKKILQKLRRCGFMACLYIVISFLKFYCVLRIHAINGIYCSKINT